MSSATATVGADLALIKRDVVDVVAEKLRQFQEGKEIHLPANYSVENAMKSAWLVLQATKTKDDRPVLEVCTRNSIANSLLDMAVQGLNPAKKQCYFLPYGTTLVCQRSYFGTMAVTKQVAGAKDIWAEVVYKGDEFEYTIDHGRKHVLKHVQRIENVKPENILAAYCTIEFADGREYTDIMTFDEIKVAWSKSRNDPNKDGSVHKQFPDQMCKRTVINRTCKKYINSSSDDNLFLKHFNRADEEAAEEEMAEEAAANANGEVIDIEPVTVTDTPVADPDTQSPSAETTAQSAPAPTPVPAPAPTQPPKAPVQAQLPVTEGPGY